MSSRAQLFIGRLPIDIRERDVEQVFEKYGRMLRCDVKYGMYGGSTGRRGAGRTGMAYAFVDYDDRRDAEDAIKYENGKEMRGQSIVVEWARGPSYRSGGGSNYQRNSNYRRESYGRSSRQQNSEECYRCRRTGHWARDCPESYYPRSSRNRSRSRSRSRSRHHRSVSLSRSRSRDRNRRSPSDYRQKSRSLSRDKRARPRSPTQSASRSRSRSVEKNRKKSEKSKRSKPHTASKSASRSRTPSKSASRSPSFPRKGKSPQKSPDDNYKYNDKRTGDFEQDRSLSRSPCNSRSMSKEKGRRYAEDSDRSVSRSKSR